MMVEIGRDIANIYTKDEQNHQDMNHLLNYILVKDGFTFARDSFINVMPVVILQDIISSISPAHSLLKSETLDDNKYIEVFGATLNEMANEVSKSILTSHKNNFYLRGNPSANARIELKKFKDDSSLDYSIPAIDSRFNEDITLEQGLASGKIKAISTEGALYSSIKKDHIIRIGKDDTPYKVVGSFRLSNKIKKADNFANKFSILTGYTKEYYEAMSKTDPRLSAKGYITILEPVSKETAEKQPLAVARGAVQYDSSLEETYVNLFAKLGPTQE